MKFTTAIILFLGIGLLIAEEINEVMVDFKERSGRQLLSHGQNEGCVSVTFQPSKYSRVDIVSISEWTVMKDREGFFLKDDGSSEIKRVTQGDVLVGADPSEPNEDKRYYKGIAWQFPKSGLKYYRIEYEVFPTGSQEVSAVDRAILRGDTEVIVKEAVVDDGLESKINTESHIVWKRRKA